LSVTPAAVRRELGRLGYALTDAAGRGGDTWTDPEAAAAPSVLVPREDDEHVAGYQATLSSALERISWITGEPATVIAQRLTGTGDRIELRIVHQLTARHSLRVLDAPKVIEGFVGMIKNGARTEFRGARPDHRGHGGEDYDDALDGIELLAPAPGSFRLVAVVGADPQLSLHAQATATKSRSALLATLKTVEAFSRETRAAADLTDDDIEELVDAGVSVQLLKAVENLAITETSGLVLEFSGQWDGTLGQPPPRTDPVVIGDAQISLGRGLLPILRRYEPREDHRMVGWVTSDTADALHREGRVSGTVFVRTTFGGRSHDVQLVLGDDLFPLVKAGISFIRATGTLERVAGRWHLTDPQQIEILDAAPEDA
ncbi:MAG: hypothetical protein WKF96_17235, partial [Solirubrobacteraceae bacterium]